MSDFMGIYAQEQAIQSIEWEDEILEEEWPDDLWED